MKNIVDEKLLVGDVEAESGLGIISLKELEILKFINEFGFCEIRHIIEKFSTKKSSCYAQLKILVRMRLVNHVRILQNSPGVYYLTKAGARLIDMDLPAMSNVSPNIYEHQLTVVEVHLKLKKNFPDAYWITERRLKRENNSKSAQRKDHLPDGVLVFQDGNQVAIEVEISVKSRERIGEIIEGYHLQGTFSEVWYFCSEDVISVVRCMAKDMPIVKVHHLKEALNDEYGR